MVERFWNNNFDTQRAKENTEKQEVSLDDYVSKEESIKESLKQNNLKELYETLKENYENWEFNDFTKDKVKEITRKITEDENITEEIMEYFIDFDWDIEEEDFMKMINSLLLLKWQEVKQEQDKTEIEQNKEFINNAWKNLVDLELILSNSKISEIQNIVSELRLISEDLRNLNNPIEAGDRLTEIVQIFKNKPQLLEELSLELKNENPKQYEQLRITLESIDTSFTPIFDSIEAKWQTRLLSPEKLTNIKANGDRIEHTTSDDFIVSASNTDRYLRKNWSNYELKSWKVNKTLLNTIDNTSKILQEKTKSLNESLNNINSINLLIETWIENDLSLEEMKTEINKYYPEYGAQIKWFDSISQIKDFFALIYKEKEEEVKTYEKEYNNYIASLIKQEELKEKDKTNRQKKILDLFGKYFIDKIPKSVIDNVFDYINSNPSIKSQYNITQIDLENWNLWININQDEFDINYMEEKKFVELINKMLTWDSRIPYELEWDILYFYNSVEDLENKKFASIKNPQVFINEKLWANQYAKIIQNLKSKNQGEIKA